MKFFGKLKIHYFAWFLIFWGLLGWGGFVSMQNQVIAFYQDSYFASYDTESDNSFQKYVGNWNYLSDLNYVPDDLVAINSNFTANNSKRFYLRKDVAEIFADMAWAFWNENNWDKLYITSAYRSGKSQELLIKNGCSSLRCAKIWASEHQLWLAVDLWVVTKSGRYYALCKWSKYYNWLLDRWPERGFHNSFQKWVDIDWQMEEPRHWRYLGESLAKNLRDNEESFAERYAFQQIPDYLAY